MEDASDEERAALAAAAAESLRNADEIADRGDPVRALQILRERALPRAQASGDLRTIARVQGRLAWFLDAAGREDDAFRFVCEELVPTAEQLGDARVLAHAHRELGRHLITRGDPDRALALLDGARAVFQETGDLHAEVIAVRWIGSAFVFRGGLDRALAVFRDDLLPLAIRHGEPREHGLALTMIAGLLAESGRRDEALAMYRDQVLPHAMAAGLDHVVDDIRHAIAELSG